ncbi:MAG: SurA N-terminal domain-containing protein [Candidatus Nanoarchaeia archaeon]
MKKILVMIMLLIFAVGCQGGEETTNPGPTGEAVSPDENPDEQEQDDSVAAEVNGEEILMSDVEQIQQMAQQQGQQVDEATVAEQLVDQKLLIEEAKDRGLEVSTEEAEDFVEESVSAQGMTLEDVKSQVGDEFSTLLEEQKEQLLIQKLLDDEGGNLTVTDEEIEEFYEENKQMLGNSSLEEVKPELEPMIEQQKQQEIITSLSEELKEDAEIEMSDDLSEEQPQMPEGGQQQMPQGGQQEQPQGGQQEQPQEGQEIEIQ